MISKETEQLFGEWLMAVAKAERSVEILRVVLCDLEEFNPYNVFWQLDQGAKGYINSETITDFMNSFDDTMTDEQIKLIMYRFDPQFTGFVKQVEFFDYFVPRDKSIRGKMKYRQLSTTKKSKISFEVHYAMYRVMAEEIYNYNGVAEILEYLQVQEDFSIIEVWNILDVHQRGYVNIKQLNGFLRDASFDFCQIDLQSIIRRIDLEDKDRFTYQEFVDAMFPEGYTEPYFARAPSPDRVETYCTFQNARISSQIRNSSPLKPMTVFMEEDGYRGLTPDQALKVRNK